MRVHFVVNGHRPDAVRAADETAKWLAERDHEVAADAESGRFLDLSISDADSFSAADLVVAFGGDGTLIRAAHLASENGAPILGVYYGRFGFVTQCVGSEVRACISDFVEGRCEIESRMMLEAVLTRAGQTVVTIHALNEVALQRDVSSRMMTFRVEVDGRALTQYPADGVLVASPTGSTGYNLSTGGPILDPKIRALVLTAIAPHTLTARTLVLAPDSEVVLAVQSAGDAVLVADGKAQLHLLSGDAVRVRKSPRTTKLVSVERDDFLIKLGHRLNWSLGLGEERA